MKIDKNVQRRSFILTVLAAVPFLKTNALASDSETKRIKSMTGHLFHDTKSRVVRLDAKPEPIEIDTARTAVIVCDMQNDFGTKGGMFDRAGLDISMIQRVVGPTAKVLASARQAGIKIIYLKMGYSPDLSDLGAPDAVNRMRHLRFGVGKTIRAPDGSESRILIRDTWNTDIVPESRWIFVERLL
jgi:hypothetical protein